MPPSHTSEVLAVVHSRENKAPGTHYFTSSISPGRQVLSNHG